MHIFRAEGGRPEAPKAVPLPRAHVTASTSAKVKSKAAAAPGSAAAAREELQRLEQELGLRSSSVSTSDSIADLLRDSGTRSVLQSSRRLLDDAELQELIGAQDELTARAQEQAPQALKDALQVRHQPRLTNLSTAKQRL